GQNSTDSKAHIPPARDLRWWSEKLALATFLGVGGYYLLTEHRAHVFGLLPYAIFLLCPIMHLFMHHGHKLGAGDSK
ncbi:DUF2933 domain-containing protein, partial [Pseudomonas aeruginosa]|uniref:DUF2933 domain-containing protein n=1 Tax=Pseudomonas aeruginosa TaxID=287 RepID=UPI003C6DC034